MRKATIIFLFLIIPYTSYSQKYVNREYNFTLNVPAKGWDKPQEVSQPNEKLDKLVKSVVIFINRGEKKSLIVQILENKDNMSMASKKYRENFKSAVVMKNMKLLSERLTKLAGIPCYKLTLRGAVGGKTAYMQMMALNVAGFQYNLTGVSEKRLKAGDSLERIMESFSFIKPPRLPRQKK
jgi:hypothetical protein